MSSKAAIMMMSSNNDHAYRCIKKKKGTSKESDSHDKRVTFRVGCRYGCCAELVLVSEAWQYLDLVLAIVIVIEVVNNVKCASTFSSASSAILEIQLRSNFQSSRRRSNLSHRTRTAQRIQRLNANRSQEEWVSATERRRQRMAQIRAERRAARLEDVRLCEHIDLLTQFQVAFHV
ncbi:unnamed protein product [Onchocerca ochengi]|uniref:BZIP domain-containing protein n=1 Tax=Onchocerca ochengi TaxID=42157 RepID=A0A182EDB1_ONCOC|nr:unnamed protein product [Onchocerca ochengi]